MLNNATQSQATVLPGPELARIVIDHMTTHCPGAEAGDWEIGQHPTNRTIGIVWRVGAAGFTQPGVRGTTLYRWLNSLKDAGFAVEARTDMTVFGRPDEHVATAWWLSVDGWSLAAVRHQAPVQRTVPPKPTPSVTLPLKTRTADLKHYVTGEFPESVTFEYKPAGLEVIADYPDWSERIPFPEAWLVDLAAANHPALSPEGL
ncbi:hypothetical protein [Streptomyces sp. NPDC059258]|uniref:hypothetical protein n=1 Tax=unclassified Streptomyces TaxID=2593676 RepID=UPI00369FA6C4